MCFVGGEASTHDLYHEVWLPSQHLHFEKPELVADLIELVDHRLYPRVLVEDDLPDDILVRQVFLPDVEVRDVADGCEGRGQV